jgi:competence protein ComEC
VISVGAGNDYGHPAPGTVSALAGTGERVLRTDRDGSVAVVETRRAPLGGEHPVSTR